jgi:N-acetylglucosamine malate deacetylase 1
MIERLVRMAVGRRRVRSLRTLIENSCIHTQQPAALEPEAGKVLVLAPHMDDETLGCGGTVARHVQMGADVTVVFLTDGRRGGPQPDIARIRKEEARCAADVLGVRAIEFLDAEDGRLHADVRVPHTLRRILQRERPDYVYLPCFLEQHSDHRAANGVLFDAVLGTGLEFECRGYEVWTPLFPNCVINIDSTIELKMRAIDCYRSQLAQMNYRHAAIGLNAHRSLAIGGKASRFAEAFQALPLADYRRLYRALPASMLK